MPAVGLCKRIAETKYENLVKASINGTSTTATTNSANVPVIESVFGDVMDSIVQNENMMSQIEECKYVYRYRKQEYFC